MKFLVRVASCAAIIGIGASSVVPAAAGDLDRPAIANYGARDWSGLYVGVSAGEMSTSDIGGGFVFPAAAGNSFIVPGNTKFTGGGHIGIQHQMGNFVFGVEGGFKHRFGSDFASTPGLGNAPPVGCNAATVFSCQARLDEVWQGGGRLGYATNNLLFYGIGGVARADIQTQAQTIATGALLAQGTGTHTGWYGGGGVEWAFNKNVILGLEYTHYDFNTQVHDTGGNSRFVSANADSVMGRLSFKLGREPVAHEPLK